MFFLSFFFIVERWRYGDKPASVVISCCSRAGLCADKFFQRVTFFSAYIQLVFYRFGNKRDAGASTCVQLPHSGERAYGCRCVLVSKTRLRNSSTCFAERLCIKSCPSSVLRPLAFVQTRFGCCTANPTRQTYNSLASGSQRAQTGELCMGSVWLPHNRARAHTHTIRSDAYVLSIAPASR